MNSTGKDQLAALHLTTLDASVVIPVPYTRELTPVEEVQLVSAITNVYTYLDPRALVVTRRKPVFDSASFGDATEAVTRVSFSYAVQSVSQTTDTTAPKWAFVDIDGNTVSDDFGLFSSSSTTTSSSSEADAIVFSKDLQNGTLFVFNDHNAVAAPSPPLVATGGAPSPPPINFSALKVENSRLIAVNIPYFTYGAEADRNNLAFSSAVASMLDIPPARVVVASFGRTTYGDNTVITFTVLYDATLDTNTEINKFIGGDLAYTPPSGVRFFTPAVDTTSTTGAPATATLISAFETFGFPATAAWYLDELQNSQAGGRRLLAGPCGTGTCYSENANLTNTALYPYSTTWEIRN